MSAFKLPAKHKAKGEAAETTFQRWLDRSAVPYIYIEQTPMTVPAGLRGRIKRPDYLVGVPHIGALAFDVKAKSIYDGCLIFDRDELDKLATFARMFKVTMYFACFDGDDPDGMTWVALAEVLGRPTERRARRAVVTIPKADGFHVPLSRPFMEALFAFTDEALRQ